MQIPKAQNDTDNLIFFFALLGSVGIVTAHKHVGEIYPWFQWYSTFCKVEEPENARKKVLRNFKLYLFLSDIIKKACNKLLI